MNLIQKNDIVFRILSDSLYCEIDGVTYVVNSPNVKLLYRANELEKKILHREKFNTEWLTKEEIEVILVRQEIIKPDIEKILKDLHTQQDDIKLAMYKAFLQPENLAQLRKRLEMLKKLINETYYKKHSMDYLTKEGFAATCRAQFLLMHTVRNESGEPLWTNDEDVNYPLLDSIMAMCNERTLTNEQFREIARTEPWRSYWSADKTNVIGGPTMSWTEDQRTLVSYSKMYDSIYENPDSPSEDIINDDDVLDGWIVNRKREAEKEKKKEQLESLLDNKLKDADNIFMIAKDQKAAQEIFDLNTPEMRRIKAQRDKAIQEHGILKESELPDVQLERLVQVNR